MWLVYLFILFLMVLGKTFSVSLNRNDESRQCFLAPDLREKARNFPALSTPLAVSFL